MPKPFLSFPVRWNFSGLWRKKGLGSILFEVNRFSLVDILGMRILLVEIRWVDIEVASSLLVLILVVCFFFWYLQYLFYLRFLDETKLLTLKLSALFLGGT